jgi:hypothetical protein
VLNVERYISVFDKKDNFLYEVNVDFIDLDALKKIFPPYQDDPYFIMLYQIGENEANELAAVADFEFDFQKYQYELTTYEKK